MPRYFITVTTVYEAATKADATEAVRDRINLDAFPETVTVEASEIGKKPAKTRS